MFQISPSKTLMGFYVKIEALLLPLRSTIEKGKKRRCKINAFLATLRIQIIV